MSDWQKTDTSIQGIDTILTPGWNICYETKIKQNVYIRSWGHYLGILTASDTDLTLLMQPNLHFYFWQEVYPAAVKAPGSRTRLLSKLICTPEFKPICYNIKVGNTRVNIHFIEGTARINVDNGDTSVVPVENVAFLLAGNMVPQLALALKLFIENDALPFKGCFFSPDSLKLMEYELVPSDKFIVDNLGERIKVDSEGWIKNIEFDDRELTVTAVNRTPPRWRNTGFRSLPYQPPPNVYVRDFDVSGPLVKHRATLAIPASNKLPAGAMATFLAGSGSHDRHGRQGRMDLGYHHMLDELAASGIATFRFDRRGSGDTAIGDATHEASFSEVIEEAERIEEIGRMLPECRGLPPFIIGHSQGGIVALALGAHHPNRYRGIVLLACTGRSIEEVLSDQVRFQASDLRLSRKTLERRLKTMQAFFKCVREVPEWNNDTVPGPVLALSNMRKWYLELMEYDPQDLIRHQTCPVLIVQGDADIQVKRKDAQLLYEAALSAGVDAKLVILPKHDHLFKRAVTSDLSRYGDRRRRITKIAIATIHDWIRSLVIHE